MRILLLLLCTILTFAGFAQQADSLKSNGQDTVMLPASIPPAKVLSGLAADTMPFFTPKKIALFSAVVPGLGQIYNKQYWRAGIVYVGVGAAIYFLQDNLRNYNAFRREYAGRTSNDPNYVIQFPEYDNINTIKLARDYYRRNLDLTALLTGAGYLLQVVDAVVYAHLKGFDISEDISLRARPVIMPQGGLGFGLVMNF